jgi:hypothetical protein
MKSIDQATTMPLMVARLSRLCIRRDLLGQTEPTLKGSKKDFLAHTQLIRRDMQIHPKSTTGSKRVKTVLSSGIMLRLPC